MKESDDKQPISGIIQLDDVYWGGAVIPHLILLFSVLDGDRPF
jgi:hypothetical protein